MSLRQRALPTAKLDWYIDAWAVRDGMAFASLRPPQQILLAQSTVFIGVPDLAPVRLGRFGPALRATRANFQERLHNEEGLEIGFTNLEQVRELVRRGYLAGGSGGDGEPESDPTPTPPPEGDGNFTAGNPRGALPAWPQPQAEAMFADPAVRARYFDLLLEPAVADRLFDSLGHLALATLFSWDRELVRQPAQEETYGKLSQWLEILLVAGIWPSLDAFRSQVAPSQWRGASELMRELVVSGPWGRNGPRWVLVPDTPQPGAGQALHLEEVIFSVPMPSGWPASGRALFLADALSLAVAARDGLEVEKYPGELVPALLPALLFALASVAGSRPRFWPMSHGARHALLRLALAWLSQQMPQIDLPRDAERVLTRYALRQRPPGQAAGAP